MNKIEIINEIKKRNLEIAGIMDTIAEEKRELKNVEKITVESLKEEVRELELQLKATPNVEANKPVVEPMNFNILRSISDYVNKGKFDDATLKMIEAGQRQFRDSGFSPKGQLILPFQYNERATIAAGTSTSGQEFVPEMQGEAIGALRNNLVLAQAGAHVITGLVGEVSLPKYAGTSVSWAAETANASDGAGATSEIKISGKRLTAYVDVSKQFLAQTSIDAQNMLIKDINAAIAEKLEASILSSFSGSTTQPKGLLNGVATTSVTVSLAEMLGLESTLATSNVTSGQFAYITHPNVNAKLKGTAAFTNGSISIKDALAYPVLVTSAMPLGASTSRGTLFANWKDLVIGQWGAVDITIDPFTQAIGGKVRLVVNCYFDWAMKRTESVTGKYYA